MTARHYAYIDTHIQGVQGVDALPVIQPLGDDDVERSHAGAVIGGTGESGKSAGRPPLVIDADAALTSPITRQGLQTVSRERSQVARIIDVVQDHQLGLRTPLNVCRELPGSLPVCDRLGVWISVAADHDTLILSTISSEQIERRDDPDQIVLLTRHQ